MPYLYRFDVTFEKKTVNAVIYAETNNEAFEQMDIELEKYYLRDPGAKEITLREKKRVVKKSGFILDGVEKG